MKAGRYFYHIKFEVYHNPSPAAAPRESHSTKLAGRSARPEIYVPPPGTDIFTSNLPAHTRPVEPKRTRHGSKAEGDIKVLGFGIQADATRRRRSTIIDCGPLRADPTSSLQAGQSRRAHINEPHGGLDTLASQYTVDIAVRDWRFGPVRVEGIDMGPAKEDHTSTAGMVNSSQATTATTATTTNPTPSVRGSINAGPRSHTTKAKIEPLPARVEDGRVLKNTQLGWGVVHLYRDGEESPELGSLLLSQDEFDTKHPAARAEFDMEQELDTTILCIPAVPSYMTPSDFLGWVGENTRDEVSHFRMVMTGRMNRYLVLMKFRDAKVARKWREDWDGRVFGGLEPENCHVMFIKSIVFQSPSERAIDSFPNPNHDPFTPMINEATIGTSLALKPFPPPTPSLVELPTCPVCLERMDDTTGLLTILCQHVFHCACLSKWRGSGCPVCRHTQPHASLTQPFGTTASDICSVCDCSEDLWICLICGHVGCGRYRGGHAKDHWKETAHNYALEIETQHVWDYAGDLWVHRLIQTKGDGKLVELPSNSRPSRGFGGSREDDRNGDLEMVPRAKLENIGLEYTHLLTSQLESQRIYYEEIVKKAVDKASSASKTAEAACTKAEEALSTLSVLSLEQAKLRNELIPELEKERDRMKMKAEKSSELARTMTKNWQEEKKVGEGLMQRIKHINEGMAILSTELTKAKAEREELKEQNRDLSFFISGSEKLKEVGTELGEEMAAGTISLPEQRKDQKDPKGGSKGKGKGRGKVG